MMHKLSEEFDARNILVLWVGNDTVANYRKWIRDIEELQGVRVSMPLLADIDCSVLKSVSCRYERVNLLLYLGLLFSNLCFVVWVCSILCLRGSKRRGTRDVPHRY